MNCSVLGWGDDVEASVCEQPVSNGTLSYADKYLSGAKAKGGAKAPAGGMKSIRSGSFPRPYPDALTARIQEAAQGGVSRHRCSRRHAGGFPGVAGAGLVRRQ